jgi:hypothetical protein
MALQWMPVLSRQQLQLGELQAAQALQAALAQ